jgi:hypothetical protein
MHDTPLHDDDATIVEQAEALIRAGYPLPLDIVAGLANLGYHVEEFEQSILAEVYSTGFHLV